MNTTSRQRSKVLSFFGQLLYTSLAVCGLGFASTPVQATSVTVDPSPLIVQASLPPNITLMLDDSGSMAWDVMPDYTYLTSTSADALVSAANNGVYYNPATTYTLPPYANGTSYATPSFTAAWVDGFTKATTVNLTTYNGSDDDDYESSNEIVFTKSFPYTQVTSSVSPACPASTTGGTATTITGPSGGLCTAVWKYSNTNHKNSYGTTCSTSSGPGYNRTNATCTQTNYSACASGTYNSADGKCEVSTSGTVNFFSFTTANSTPVTSSTTYTRHYVAANTGDCALAGLSTASVTGGYPICDESTVTQQNVANWYSYWHTRILMAKSGLLTSFATVNSSYRVGFGSINGNNYRGLPTLSAQYGSNNTYIAEVAPFGDGSAGTQKANFWNWVTGESANNGTPLRESLDAVGQYYQTSQPWSTMSTDPDPTGNASTELACRQSYTILTTDGFWNGDTPSNIGDQDDTAGPTVTGANSQTYTYAPVAPYTDSSSFSSVAAQCSSSSYTLTAPGGTGNSSRTLYECVRYHNRSYSDYTPTCSSGTLSADQSTCTGVGGYSDTLADVAMKYWKTDLRTSTANEVPKSTDDPAFWQHMTTFTLGLGFTPVYSDQTTQIPVDQVFAWANGSATDAISGFTWPQPSSNSLMNIADLAHAAVNGHGGFYSATSPDAFTSGLETALSRVSERLGTGASLAANSTQLQTGTVAYQANYVTSTWTGDLQAFSVDSSSGVISATDTWSAVSELPASSSSSRDIYTYNPTTSSAVAFKVASDGTLPSLSTAQNTALSSVAGTATSEAHLINYLRGDNTYEKGQPAGGTYRARTTPMGDIVDSQPVYVGTPDPNQFYGESFSGTASFSQYASTTSGRTALIYVAANDGMLHAFNASTGAEAYAYLPGAVITNGLSSLADLNYGGTTSHEYFNDGELTVADAYVSGAWKTILVGTTGRGLAKAVYALDITDPTQITLLWERSALDGLTNSNYIGQMTGKPVIAQTANGTWSVLMGNGYNNAAGAAALLQFDLTDGTLHVHTTTDTSGLAAPAVWMDPSGNGVATIAYAGDADGDVWSFSLNTSTDNPDTPTPDSTGTKLFTAKDGSGNAQPITAGMLAGKDAQTGDVWVFFGTGKYLSSSDLTDTSTQSWYGLIVQSTDSTNAPMIASTDTRTANLAVRAITAETAASGTTLAGRTITTASVATSLTGKSGWYIDLLSPTGTAGADVAQGERMVTPNQFQGNLLLGTTRIPKATDACNPSGTGWIMAIDPFTGTNPASNFFDRNGDGSIDSNDSINGTPSAGVGFGSLPNNPIFVGGSMLTSFDNGSTSSIKTSSSTGGLQRVSWRDLINQ